MARIITVTSGKGGVGKTNISTNLALHLASLGFRTCILDADLGLANINILLGLYPEHTIEDALLNGRSLADIIIKDYQGIDIIPGSSGVEKIANIEPAQTENIIKSFSVLENYDFLFLDTSAGISKSVIPFCLASSELIVVITPEPTSLTDAYALLKILCLNHLQSSVRVVVNQCKSTTVAKQTYNKFKEVVKKYLAIDIHPLGVILKDTKLTEAVTKQQPFISLFPACIASKCIKIIAKNLLEHETDDLKTYNMETFWRHCISLFQGPLNLEGTRERKKESLREAQESDLSPEHAEKKLLVEPALQAEDKPEEGLKPEDEQAPVQAEKSAEPIKQVITSKGDAEPKTPFNMDPQFYLLMDKLVNSIAIISNEVMQLRKTIEGNGTISPDFGSADKMLPANEKPKPVTLDFDKYLQTHKTRDPLAKQ